MVTDCRFCGIETKQADKVLAILPSTVVAFSDPRLMPGHLLVIPKRHVESLMELNESERKQLFDTAITYQQRIMQSIAPGCDLKQHNRPMIPENDLKVDHVHIHLQPREFEDELYLKAQVNERTVFKPLDQDEVTRISSLLKETS